MADTAATRRSRRSPSAGAIAKVEAGEIQLHQPPHFIAEVIGVIARICPEEAPDILNDLLYTEMRREEDSEIYATATKLSIRLNHHLFDTLYHTTALHTPEAVYLTADRRYYDKAKDLASVARMKRSEIRDLGLRTLITLSSIRVTCINLCL